METVDLKTKSQKTKKETWQTKQRRAAAGLAGKMKNIDMFGTTVGFNICGEDTFTTWLGALLSLMIYAVGIAYAGYKFVSMIKKDDAQVVTIQQINEIDDNF